MNAVEAERRQLISLDRDECLQLLATVPVGRLIFTVNALPAVRLMNFALLGDVIVVRTAPEATVMRKAPGSVVAFEVDQVDAAASTGWSVTVTGRAARVTSPEAAARYSSLRLVPWAPGARDDFLTIRAEVVEGRKITVLD